jgi:membrane protease YdiL (CAAX protease family)
MERVELITWTLLTASLVSIPLAFVLSSSLPVVFLIVSVSWLLSPMFFTEDRALFNLCLAHSLFFLILYVRVLVSSAAEPVDQDHLFTYHLEQGVALLVLLVLARRFFSFPALRLTRDGLVRALLIGLAVGLPYGVLDQASGEGLIEMPSMGFVNTFIWIATLAVFVGLLEELLFRGILYGAARGLVGSRMASLYQAVLFSAVHYPNPLSALAAALLFSVVMVYILERTGNLFAPAAAHAANNTVWMMLGRFAPITF